VDLRKTDWGWWIGFDWLIIGTGDLLLWLRWWTFFFLLHGVRIIDSQMALFLGVTSDSLASTRCFCTILRSDHSY
jgi:hypothetical protein